jgi:hypothetical protein
MTKNDEGEC